ncbi:MAG: transcriptional regulator [Promethearchaeota archaeon]
MAFPCEKVVREHLPAIKSALARALVKEGMTQVEVSKLLGTTEATISHYMKGERGSAVILGKHILEAVDNVAKKIKSRTISDEQITEEVCGICQNVRRTCAVCGAETMEACAHCTYE